MPAHTDHTTRPHPHYTGSVWICPVCRWTWHLCDCAEGEKCHAPTATTPTRAGRGVAAQARRAVR